MRREQQSPNSALDNYFSDVSYGPQFSCLVCQRHHFLGGVVEAVTVGSLATRNGRERYLDETYISAHPALFTQLDRQWVCLGCRDVMNRGEMPVMAANNGLQATWSSLPSDLLTLTQEELEVLSLTQVSSTVHGLKVGVAGVGNPTKTLFVPLTDVLHAPRLLDQEHSPEQVLDMHARPSGQEVRLRKDLLLQAWELLLYNHSRYRLSDEGRRIAEEFMRTFLEEKEEEMRRRGEGGEEEERGIQVNLDHFAAWAPQVRYLQSVLLPDRTPQVPGGLGLLQAGLLETSLHCLYDLKQEGGLGAAREVPLSRQQWTLQRLSNVHRLGPCSRANLVFSLLLDKEARLLLPLSDPSVREVPHSLLKHRGSSPYYWKIREDLQAVCVWCGPPVFSLTVPQNSGTLDFLGTRVSHSAGVEGRDQQNWHQSSEQKFLTTRPGKVVVPGLAEYWVHTHSGVRDDNCPYHQHCHRSPLEDFTARLVVVTFV